MRELCCFKCSKRIGWITDSGPIGFVYCEECYEEEKDG